MLSAAGDDGGEAYGEIDTYAVHLNLSKAHIAGWELHIRRYQCVNAIADLCLYAQGQVDGSKESVGGIGIMEIAACLTSKEVIIIVAMFLSKEIGGDAGAGKEYGTAAWCPAKIITYIDGYLQHVHGTFYKVCGLHTILSEVIGRCMVVDAPRGIVLSGEQEACSQV